MRLWPPRECPSRGYDTPDRVAVKSDVDALERVGGAQLGPVLAGQRVEGDQVLLGRLEQAADLRRQRLEALEHVRDALLGLLVAVADGQPHTGQARLRRPRGNSTQKAPDSTSPTSRPITSRTPD
jgi:hypothetical protein